MGPPLFNLGPVRDPEYGPQRRARDRTTTVPRQQPLQMDGSKRTARGCCPPPGQGPDQGSGPSRDGGPPEGSGGAPGGRGGGGHAPLAQRQPNWLPRAELPEFKGTLTEWAKFRRGFQALADDQYPDAVYLHQLKARIPREGQNLLLQILSADEAWRVLDGHYGNKDIIVATVVERLLNTKL